MKINTANYKPNFGRALTTQEKYAYKNLLRDSQKALGITDTTAIIFDFNVPSENGYNLGIGSTFSDEMPRFTNFIKEMTGITSMQLQPQGKITSEDKSPYSGTNFAFGDHIIDLKRLTQKEYAYLLTDNDIKKANAEYSGNRERFEYRTDYDYVIGTEDQPGIQEKLLRKAFRNFGFSMDLFDEDAAKLNWEFRNFKKANNYWLEKELIFTILTEEYGTDDYTQWSDEDSYLYSETTPEGVRQERISQLLEQYSDITEYESFKQFIADKQQKESKRGLNSLGIKVNGDCLLGFSKSEIWSNIDCFKDNLFFGGPDPNCTKTNNIQTWGFPALDYTKLIEIDSDGMSKLGAAGKLLYDKYHKFFERYDGVRIDAAWQYVTPFIYKEENGKYSQVETPEIKYTIINIINAAAKSAMGENFDIYNPSGIMLELVGLSADESRNLTKNKYPHLYSTEYAEYGETPAKLKQNGYENGKFYVGVGNHDNHTLVQQARNKTKRQIHIKDMKDDYRVDLSKIGYASEEYISQTADQKTKENYRNAKFAEIFTSAKQFFTLPDMFGMSERINISGKKSESNWRVRIPSDYEKFYFTQLSNGYGLNIPKSYENAMLMNHVEYPQLLKKLSETAEILRQKGPMTEKEANEAAARGELKNKLVYEA